MINMNMYSYNHYALTYLYKRLLRFLRKTHKSGGRVALIVHLPHYFLPPSMDSSAVSFVNAAAELVFSAA